MGKQSPLPHIPSKNPLRCAAIDNLQLSVPSGGAWTLGQLRPRAAGDWKPRVQDPGCLGYRWSVDLKEPGLRLGRGRRWRPLVGKQEDTIFQSCRKRRAEVNRGGTAHQSLLFYFVINVKDEEVAVS